MNLPQYFPSQKPKVSLKGLKKILRKHWRKRLYTDFDVLLTKFANCDLETAEKIRELWEELGFLGYDSRGFLCWC